MFLINPYIFFIFLCPCFLNCSESILHKQILLSTQTLLSPDIQTTLFPYYFNDSNYYKLNKKRFYDYLSSVGDESYYIALPPLGRVNTTYHITFTKYVPHLTKLYLEKYFFWLFPNENMPLNPYLPTKLSCLFSDFCTDDNQNNPMPISFNNLISFNSLILHLQSKDKKYIEWKNKVESYAKILNLMPSCYMSYNDIIRSQDEICTCHKELEKLSKEEFPAAYDALQKHYIAIQNNLTNNVKDPEYLKHFEKIKIGLFKILKEDVNNTQIDFLNHKLMVKASEKSKKMLRQKEILLTLYAVALFLPYANSTEHEILLTMIHNDIPKKSLHEKLLSIVKENVLFFNKYNALASQLGIDYNMIINQILNVINPRIANSIFLYWPIDTNGGDLSLAHYILQKGPLDPLKQAIIKYCKIIRIKEDFLCYSALKFFSKILKKNDNISVDFTFLNEYINDGVLTLGSHNVSDAFNTLVKYINEHPKHSLLLCKAIMKNVKSIEARYERLDWNKNLNKFLENILKAVAIPFEFPFFNHYIYNGVLSIQYNSTVEFINYEYKHAPLIYALIMAPIHCINIPSDIENTHNYAAFFDHIDQKKEFMLDGDIKITYEQIMAHINNLAKLHPLAQINPWVKDRDSNSNIAHAQTMKGLKLIIDKWNTSSEKNVPLKIRTSPAIKNTWQAVWYNTFLYSAVVNSEMRFSDENVQNSYIPFFNAHITVMLYKQFLPLLFTIKFLCILMNKDEIQFNDDNFLAFSALVFFWGDLYKNLFHSESLKLGLLVRMLHYIFISSIIYNTIFTLQSPLLGTIIAFILIDYYHINQKSPSLNLCHALIQIIKKRSFKDPSITIEVEQPPVEVI